MERQSILKLRNNHDIVIKEADKGSAIVVMNTEFYIEKMLEMLNKDNTYEKVAQNRDKFVMTQIK